MSVNLLLQNSKTHNFIVIGNPITHSKSPAIHQSFAQQGKLDIRYSRQFCPDNRQSFEAVVQAFFNGGGTGANVTVPFKQMAYEMCADNLTPFARVAQAVNTFYLNDGKLCGDNTDGQGLVNHLVRLGWELANKKVAIIGAGGASRGIILPLLLASVGQLTVVNRTVTKAEQLIAGFQQQLDILSTDIVKKVTQAQLKSGSINELSGEYDVIINATSIGLSSDTLPLNKNVSCVNAYDMMYGRELGFLQHFEQLGANTSDGYGMLIGQAALSFELWTGKQVDIDTLKP